MVESGLNIDHTNSNNYFIEINKAVQQYNDKNGKPFQVLNHLNLNVRRGEFITLVGPSGCGKSTLLRLILGSERPHSGSVIVDGIEVTEPNEERGIVFQKYSLFPNRTVQENVMFGLELQEFSLFGKILNNVIPSKKMKSFKERALIYLERVGLREAADKHPHQLSGGMRQRVAIAQAMIMEPKILLMDEPFGALDIGTREQMQVFVLEQWEKTKQTVFFVTHDLEEALFLGTRVLVLSQFYEKGEGQGSKIVKDISVPWNHPRSTEIKKTEQFRSLLNSIRHEGLDPMNLQAIEEFDLSHKDATP